MKTYPLIDSSGKDIKLPSEIKIIEGNLDLDEIQYALPDSLEIINGWVDIMNYNFPLPKNLKLIKGSLFLGDYDDDFILPENLIIEGQIIRYQED